MDNVGTWCRYGAEAGGVLDLQHWHLFVKRRNESGKSERTVRRTSLGCAISQLIVKPPLYCSRKWVGVTRCSSGVKVVSC
jgi:hypothetical protein